jgi:hypothetical protein
VAYVKKKSVGPIYLVGVTWLLWSIFGSLYRPTHYILAALVSAIVYYLGKMIWPDRGYEMKDETPQAEPAGTEPPKAEKQETKAKSTGNPEIDALIAERDRAVGEMERLNASIQDPTISKQISHLESTTGKIIGAVVEKPAKLPQIRKFMNYYLPTTLKLLNAYDRMDATGVSGTNIDGTKGKIEDMMDTICTAFDKQLDGLYGEEALDISTDIKVLENMLAQEGLGGMTLGGQ